MNFLDRNEFNFSPSQKVLDAIKNFDPMQLCFYTRIYDEGKKSIFSVRLSEIYGVPEEQVLLGYGGEDILKNAVHYYLSTGGNNTIMIPEFSWWYYNRIAGECGGTFEMYPLYEREDTFAYDVDELIALTNKIHPRMLLLASPNNPTGAIYNREKLEAIVAVLRDYPNVIVLSDEIYASLSYDISPVTLAAFEPLSDRLIIVNGVSKAYAMTGYRIGWLLTKNWPFLNACIRLQGQQLTCPTMVAQKAAEAALTGSQTCMEEMREVFAQRRELICRLAADIPGWKFNKPLGAFYLFPDVSAIGSGDVVAEMLMEKAHVAVVPGSAFGCPECIRLSYAISTEEIEEAMRRIKNVFM